MDVLEQVLAEIDKRLSVLSVDKSLDALREWGRINGINDNTNPNKRDCGLDLKRQLLFRNGRVKLTDHAFTCALMLNTKEFFEIQFCSANMEMPTECFSIVNLVDRDQPLVHRTVQLEDPNRIMDRFYNRTISGPPTRNFEHDKRQLVIRFPVIDRQTNFISPYDCNQRAGFYVAEKGIMIQFCCIVGALLAVPEFLRGQSRWWLLFCWRHSC
ncbi:hypothetical protein niasHT_010110 [Heterodera trifolii]|uniref:PH-like domain-containing protein n=1 Tax=Heterodera trifolii TaxID=157864 RepID=A0ABD2LWD9_9BILA